MRGAPAAVAGQASDIDAPSGAMSAGERRLRWFIVGWITLSTVLNLVDRQTLSILAPTLEKEFGLTNRGYSNIVNAFLIAYTVMYTVGGRFVDRVGERVGMAACIAWWSVATMLHAAARGALSLGVFRLLLGIGEPGNYPAALRVTTRWFSRSERGLPIAVFSSGSSLGSLIAPPLISFVTLYYGWRMAFLLPGLAGLVWLLVWVLVYRHPASPVDAAGARKGARSISLLDLLRDSNVRAIVLARLISDPVWVFYLYWTPMYLASVWGYDLLDMGRYAWIPFLGGELGGLFGGAASDWLIRRGVAPAAARKRLLYAAGAVAPLGMAIGLARSSAVALALMAVMAFVVYVWFIDTAALISDVFPERVVGSVLGLMGTAGALGGIALNWLAGQILDSYGSYTPLFCIAGACHLLASLVLAAFFRDRPQTALAE